MAQVVIVGPGAMGCLHAALLAQAGVDVVLLDHRPERAARLRRQGVVLVGEDGGEERVQVRVIAEAEEAAPACFIVLMVKAYDTAAAARGAAAAGRDGTVWVTLQNGLGNVEAMAETVGEAPILAGVTTSGANMVGEGRVRVAAIGEVVVGPARAATAEQTEPFASMMRDAGMACHAVKDPWPAIWRKLVVNAAINPLAGLAGRRNGELLQVPSLHRLLRAVAEEVARVAAARGVDVGEDFNPAERVEEVCRLTAANRCSMLQDLEAGRRTEVEYINGAVAMKATPDAPAPLCEALTALVLAASGQ